MYAALTRSSRDTKRYKISNERKAAGCGLFCVKLMKKTFLTVFICALLLLLSGCSRDPEWAGHEKSGLTVAFIDVGKGDCIVISSGEHTMMIDTGYDDTVNAVKKDLSRLGIDHINELILTHYDKDHYGGAEEILHAYPVDTIYVPDYLPEGEKYERVMQVLKESRAELCKVKEREEIDFAGTGHEVKITILPSFTAYDPEEKNDNDMSLVTELHYGLDSYLFTGDIEKDAIAEFLPEAEHFDILKYPHHGDWEKNTEELLDQIDPKETVITDGDTRPVEEDTETYFKAKGKPYYTTYKNGTIVIFSSGDGNYETLCSH